MARTYQEHFVAENLEKIKTLNMTQIPLVLVKKMLMLADNYMITNFKWNFKTTV